MYFWWVYDDRGDKVEEDVVVVSTDICIVKSDF